MNRFAVSVLYSLVCLMVERKGVPFPIEEHQKSSLNGQRTHHRENWAQI
jgi:hypothetical protein